MWFFRLIFFVLLGFIVWRVVRLALRLVAGDVRIRDRRPQRMESSGPPDLRNIEDAEFEDLTPPSGDEPPPKDP